MIRTLDIIFSIIGLVCLFPVILIIALILLIDLGSPLFIQERVGKNKKTFTLIKFRTMKKGTASVATHLADASSISRIGSALRKLKLDELPQLLNVLMGEMSLVGPRPCLPTQKELIKERDIKDVFTVRPGITGLAQIQDIDMSTPSLLADVDQQMIKSISVIKYFKYILLTVVGRGRGDKVRR